MNGMQSSHPLRTFVLCIVGLIVVGAIAWWVVKVLLGLVFYLLVGAAVVGGGAYLYGKAKQSLKGGGPLGR
jgi:uncharacterized protein (DUF983 family)